MPKKQRKKQRKPMGTYVYGGRRTGMGVTVEQSGVPRPDGWSTELLWYAVAAQTVCECHGEQTRAS